jgi:hypothetical protein
METSGRFYVLGNSHPSHAPPPPVKRNKLSHGVAKKGTRSVQFGRLGGSLHLEQDKLEHLKSYYSHHETTSIESFKTQSPYPPRRSDKVNWTAREWPLLIYQLDYKMGEGNSSKPQSPRQALATDTNHRTTAQPQENHYWKKKASQFWFTTNKTSIAIG